MIRKASERGQSNLGWLKSAHTFSFAHYYDPDFMGYGPLRVINDDIVAPKMGFDTHSHRDMEILTWILEGELEHKDSMGNGSIIRPGDIQKMSAGTGVHHSEFNPSSQNNVHLLQIWIQPDTLGIQPGYEQLHVPKEERTGKLCLIASSRKTDGAVHIRQNVDLHTAILQPEHQISHQLAADRIGWLHVAKGSVQANQKLLKAGDALILKAGEALSIQNGRNAEILLFDMAS